LTASDLSNRDNCKRLCCGGGRVVVDDPVAGTTTAAATGVDVELSCSMSSSDTGITDR
jgi:hypothetical protein